MKLGSKSDVFLQDGRTWLCTTGLPSDVAFEVGGICFHLHKFPLMSRSNLLEKSIKECHSRDEKNIKDHQKFVLPLNDIPGGSEAFLLIAKFCYGVQIELNSSNIIGLRCAAEYLGMTEDYGGKNLIQETENFLNKVFCSWGDTIKALRTCEEVLTYANMLRIVSRCVDSLAAKACEDTNVLSWHSGENYWWYEDVVCLSLPLYRRLIIAIKSRGMRPERIAGSLVVYAKKYLPLMGRQSSFRKQDYTMDGNEYQRLILEEIVALLPDHKRITTTKILLKLFRLSTILQANSSCREDLEKRIGSQLEEANFEDLVIPNVSYSMETLYDVDCINRIVGHFMIEDQDRAGCSKLNSLVDGKEQLFEDIYVSTPLKMVAKLVDSYLAEVASDVNLVLAKFLSLASVIPDYARELDDGLYRAIDIYLKAHPWMTDSERDQLCRLMSSQKLSFEATSHAAQNERLPIRFISRILYIEQIKLRNSISSCYYVSESINHSKNQSGNISYSRIGSSAHLGYEEKKEEKGDDNGGLVLMKGRVVELEKRCLEMKREMEKLERKKRRWNSFCKKFASTLNFMSCSRKTSKRLANQIVECKTVQKQR